MATPIFTAEQEAAPEPIERDDEAGSDTAVAEPKRPARSQTKPRRNDEDGPPRHAVVLHNDPTNGFAFVILTLVKILKVSTDRATRFAETAHRTGRCVVWTGHKEHAELKAQQITAVGPDPVARMEIGDAARPLKTTVEPVPGT
ncbi:MAG: ATP-dependent Clp protease adaptor ClpS [Planctomycetota bacterium]